MKSEEFKLRFIELNTQNDYYFFIQYNRKVYK